MDVVDKQTRSRMMAGIKGKNTKPEILTRKALFKEGYRYRLHDKKLPGKPDLVLKKYNTVIFIHGCFWHGHNCHLFKWPKTRPAFWKKKINRNREKDQEVINLLKKAGWNIITVWECALKGKGKHPIKTITDRIAKALQTSRSCTIKGKAV